MTLCRICSIPGPGGRAKVASWKRQTPRPRPSEPFTIHVAQAKLDDLRERLRTTIWPSTIEGQSYGGPALAQMKELARQAASVRLAQAGGGAQRAAQLHHRDRRPEHPLHPRQVEAAGRHPAAAHPRLAGLGGRVPGPHRTADGPGEPRRQGAQAFDVVIPSLPGFGFSGPTRDAGWNNLRVGKAFIELMGRLGYAKFAVQGGDAGAIIGPEIGPPGAGEDHRHPLNAATIGFMPDGAGQRRGRWPPSRPPRRRAWR